jgi:hypothetical protein
MTLSGMEEATDGPDDDFSSVESSSACGGTMIPRDFFPVREYEMVNMRDNEVMAK